jgi:hypothetical protein
MYTRSATFFKRLASASSESWYLQKITVGEKEHAEAIAKQATELNRIYRMIENSAKGGGIRIFLPSKDPVWNNDIILYELTKNGFTYNTNSYTDQGVIEWYAPTHNNKPDHIL